MPPRAPLSAPEQAIELLESPLKLACKQCGAEQAYSATDRALQCSYCASVTDIPRPAEELPPAAAGAIVPLSVSDSALLDAVYEHLASGAFTPDDLLATASFVQKDRFYAPVFEFTGSYEARWTASFGYDRSEHYTDHEDRTENGRTRRVPVTRTRTVTDWRPANGQAQGRFQVRAYAGARLSPSEPALMALVEDVEAGQALPFDAAYTAGVPLEPFSLTPVAAYQGRGQPQVNASIDAGVERHGQGDRQRDWHWNATVRKQHQTVWVPVCHVVWEYQGQRYNLWTSGVDAHRQVSDPLPVDRSRVKSLVWGLAPLAIALVTGPLAIESAKEMGRQPALPLMTMFAAGAFAFWRYRAVVGGSVRRRQAFLAARRGHSSGMVGAGPKATVTARALDAAAHRLALVGACVLAVLLPVLSVVDLPRWTSQPVTAAEVEPAPRSEPQRYTPRPERSVPPSPVPREPVQVEAPTPAQAIAGVLQAANVLDWQAVSERLAQMKAVAPPHEAGDIEALNDKARRWLKQDDTSRAADALVQVVALAPHRPSAWATLTATLPDARSRLNAMRVAVHLSTDRAKTLIYLRNAEQDSTNEDFARVAAAVLREIDQIPRHPQDTGPRD